MDGWSEDEYALFLEQLSDEELAEYRTRRNSDHDEE